MPSRSKNIYPKPVFVRRKKHPSAWFSRCHRVHSASPPRGFPLSLSGHSARPVRSSLSSSSHAPLSPSLFSLSLFSLCTSRRERPPPVATSLLWLSSHHRTHPSSMVLVLTKLSSISSLLTSSSTACPVRGRPRACSPSPPGLLSNSGRQPLGSPPSASSTASGRRPPLAFLPQLSPPSASPCSSRPRARRRLRARCLSMAAAARAPRPLSDPPPVRACRPPPPLALTSTAVPHRHGALPPARPRAVPPPASVACLTSVPLAPAMVVATGRVPEFSHSCSAARRCPAPASPALLMLLVCSNSDARPGADLIRASVHPLCFGQALPPPPLFRHASVSLLSNPVHVVCRGAVA